MRLAGLFWPDTAEGTARNNLSQTLRRIKALASPLELISGGDLLTLSAQSNIDVRNLVGEVQKGNDSRVIEYTQELLSGYYYDDCPEFQQWLYVQREYLQNLWSSALRRLLERCLEAGDERGALGYTHRWVAREPLAEEAWRQLMRLHMEMGDRAAALAAYQRCAEVLARELDVEPMPETQLLYHQITHLATAKPTETGADARKILLALQHPPHLIAREQYWSQMEKAWNLRKPIFITGVLGVGKTRLARDFLASKGRYYAFDARPSDMSVPFATHSRSYRDMLRAFPQLQLPNWVRIELSHLLPELVPDGMAPAGEIDKLRLFQAKAAVTRMAVEAGMQHVLVDDMHFTDAASLEVGHYVYAQEWANARGMRSVICFNEESLSADGKAALTQVLGTGLAVLIRLEPFNREQLGEFLSCLEFQADEVLQEQLFWLSGGFPRYLLDILNTLELIEQDSVRRVRGIPAQVTHAVMDKRLNNLTHDALALVRICAVARLPINVASAANILATTPEGLAPLWQELQQARLFVDGDFCCPSLREEILRTLPMPLRAHYETILSKSII